MRPVLVLALLLLIATAESLAAPPAAREVAIPMRDGAGLAADLYLPAAPGRYPTVLIQTPYDKRWYRARLAAGALPAATAVGRGAASDLPLLVDRSRYAYVVVDWRGFFGSRKAVRNTKRRPWRRGQDGFDTVEWIARQPWSDGKVGTWGGSALGKQQLDTAAERPPHLVCCVPLIAAMGSRYEAYYEGGVLLDAHVTRLDQLGFNLGRQVRAMPEPDALLWGLVRRNSYRPRAVAVPCLFITGWWDHYPDLVAETFEDVVAGGGPAARDGSRLLIGPWDHVSVGLAKQGALAFEGARQESGRAARAFLDYWLLGAKNGWPQTPRVRYWQVGAGRWRSSQAWSAAKRETRVVRLVGEEPRRWTYDPREPPPTLGGANLPPLPHGPTDHASLRGRTDLLACAIEKGGPFVVQGNAVLRFRARLNRTSGDFVARLCWQQEETCALLAERAVRLRGAAGEEHEVTLRFPAHAFTADRLALFLGSGAHPRYERNPHTGAPHWDEKSALTLDVEVWDVRLELARLVE